MENLTREDVREMDDAALWALYCSPAKVKKALHYLAAEEMYKRAEWIFTEDQRYKDAPKCTWEESVANEKKRKAARLKEADAKFELRWEAKRISNFTGSFSWKKILTDST